MLKIVNNKKYRLFSSYFILGTHAPGAEVHLLGFAVNQNSSRMYIRIESPISMMFGMADIFPKHRSFSANITLQNSLYFDILTIAIVNFRAIIYHILVQYSKNTEVEKGEYIERYLAFHTRGINL